MIDRNNGGFCRWLQFADVSGLPTPLNGDSAGERFTGAADTGRSLAVIEPPAVQFVGITMPEAVGAEVFKSFASNA